MKALLLVLISSVAFAGNQTIKCVGNLDPKANPADAINVPFTLRQSGF